MQGGAFAANYVPLASSAGRRCKSQGTFASAQGELHVARTGVGKIEYIAPRSSTQVHVEVHEHVRVRIANI